jgi:hypothetical protein
VKRLLIIWAIALACASCADRESHSESDRAADNGLATENRPIVLPPANPQSIKPGEPGGLPDDRKPLEEGPIDPKSAEGAGQVMQRFGGLLEQGEFAEAYRLWSDDGRASGMSESQFVAAYGKYAEIHSQVGRPGESEGAAGSIYLDVPFRLYGQLKSGQMFNSVGKATMRRVNDVPGSTEEQRRWHIHRIEMQPPL